jgi:hypothetical protein
MAFGLKTTTSAQVKTINTTVMDFTAAQSVQDLWIANLSSADIEIDMWFDYTSTGSADVNKVLSTQKIARNKTLHITGLWVFANGGRITARITTGADDDATIHISKADV